MCMHLHVCLCVCVLCVCLTIVTFIILQVVRNLRVGKLHSKRDGDLRPVFEGVEERLLDLGHTHRYCCGMLPRYWEL